jgi:polar amino acid transport system permease protein
MIYSRTYQTIPLLIVATIWYLVLATVLTAIEHYIEHHLASDFKAGPAKTQLGWLKKTLLQSVGVRRSA